MWQPQSDRKLEQDVRDELLWTPSVDQKQIAVAAKDGIVTLSGSVPTFAMKFAAERSAERISGVKAIVEHLEVKYPDTLSTSDGDLAKAVASALKWDVEVPEGKIQATVDKGWVTLDGSVDWQYQRDAAAGAVRYLIGVKGVTNAIKVANTATGTDVKQRIEAALKRSAEADARNISVETKDGQVTLRGKIHSWAERDEATRAAWSASGVWKVDDQLTFAA